MPPFVALRKCGALAAVGVLPCLTAVARPFATETGTLRGTVVDDRGDILAGVRVILTRTGPESSDYAYVTARTDQQGRFRVVLRPGSWSVRWEAKGYYEVVPTTSDPFPTARPLYPEVEITNGVTRDLALRMCRGSKMKGRVLRENGQPVVRRTVRLVAGLPEQFVLEKTARTDAHGYFRIELDYAGEESFALLCPGTGYATAQPTVLGPGKTSRVDFRLKPLAMLEGRVLNINGRTLVAGASVHLSGGWPYVTTAVANNGGLTPRPGSVAVARPEVRTDAGGHFRFEALPGGEYSLRGFAPGHGSVTWKGILRDGERKRGILLRLSPQPPPE